MAELHVYESKVMTVSRFKPLANEDTQLYDIYKKSIDGKIREAFPSIPKSFQLKPVRVCRTQGCGTFFDYKVALPDQKFATVSFHTGGLEIQMMVGNEKPKKQEPSFRVKPELTSTPDE